MQTASRQTSVSRVVENAPKNGRGGWSREETGSLFALAAEAQAQARPLKAVFGEIAQSTGRRPNSVRNHYYACVREGTFGTGEHRRAFTPFSAEESVRLLEEVLRAKGRGESVRACTLRMAEGDDKRMLRYQNKYRAMLQHEPAMVRRVYEDLKRCGENVSDPYAEIENAKRVGRPRKSTFEAEPYAQRVLAMLSRVPGLDVSALLNALGTLAITASRGAARTKATESEADREAQSLRDELDEKRRQLVRQGERQHALLDGVARLLRVNAEFLSRSSVVRTTDLTNYIRDLEPSVRALEQYMHLHDGAQTGVTP